ncbi:MULTISPECIES: hypothetical protein [unclassified Streptomyces]|uniref:hypothetical protein n=1 Tax=unclassified Streptomyces TaxID=2593676 RepID=UPI002366E094|nr:MULTISPECIES: hypothetical protein [unclassified Streptomyces]MDF3142202.1 hypothetical protein [Streptomyces sp. T21Q-yed]WDF43107.1 hypothetical protein PBV52_43125 [Streptomyces sp. T12]
MTGLLAVVAVVGYMATAGLPWWVVVAVALLMAGFAAGRSGSPGKGARSTAAHGSWDKGARSTAASGSWERGARGTVASGSWDRDVSGVAAPGGSSEGAAFAVTPGPVGEPDRTSADAWSTAPPVAVNVGAACPDE